MDTIIDSAWIWLSGLAWTDVAEMLFVGASILGQQFITRRQARGFYVWIFGSVVAVLLFASLGRWMTCGLHLYFIWMSCQGIRNWAALDRTQAQVQGNLTGRGPAALLPDVGSTSAGR